ncbi:VCBS repeat-containing protein [Geobacter sp. SVR]|uniref:VCBS repeat-containing protein n=1 Tax=Geobacter sp. SVR TaxID=2495594 RepID=UPI00143F0460|nr:VCBS repeat-containing protein [Geobacter sp. SVR]BCS55668.1 hypothetical protein GSVR_39760 [Geobacter sp. SVR]GCF83672.1 hypothetical protein GSbR_02720 [Geobacter sp. SVR]
MSRLTALSVLLPAILAAQISHAAPLRVFVAEINAVGVQNRDEMKATLQTLLASRLNGEHIAAVGSASEADAVVTGTYVTIGKVFSIDATAKAANGKILTRSFIQGESQDELIPSIGKLAEKLSGELVKTAAPSPTAWAPSAAPSSTSAAFIKSDQQAVRVSGGDFIKPQDTVQNTGGWTSKRLNGAANLVAVGRSLADGGRELFLAEERRLGFYRQGADIKLVTEVEFSNAEKIISLDTMEGNDGATEIYLTVIRADEPASKVFRLQGDKLVQVAENLPYYFRAFSPAGGQKKLYAQSAGRDDDFYGRVYEAKRAGSSVTLTNPVSMPRYGTIYTFNQFRDKDGKLYCVVINPDNYLVVYDEQGTELWRSSDKFGGSELYFQKDDPANVRVTGDRRWIFMNQRIQVTAAGDVLVGKNDGFWVLGNARSYKKGSVYCMTWNGSTLEEKWRTRDTQNYMPDYFLDEGRNELMILQTVQRSGISTRGASSLAIRKVE